MNRAASSAYTVPSAAIPSSKMTGFPESFQRSTVTLSPSQEPRLKEALWSDAHSVPERARAPAHPHVNSLSFPYSPSASSAASGRGSVQGVAAMSSASKGRESSPVCSPRRVSRSNVMRLENILNDVSMNYDHSLPLKTPRSRSLGSPRLPVEDPMDTFLPSSPWSATSLPERSLSPEDELSPVSTTMMLSPKKKKVKMHRCPECQKDFPRPSGLRTHMNMHTKEKPFACTFPGCMRSFSVVSNARRHMRTHGLGVSTDDADRSPVPYVVGFEDPMVLDQPDPLDMQGDSPTRNHPFRLRWIPLAASIPSSMQRKMATAPASGDGAQG